MDLSKAFDTIESTTLLHTLNYDITTYIKLTGRQQFVKFDEEIS